MPVLEEFVVMWAPQEGAPDAEWASVPPPKKHDSLGAAITAASQKAAENGLRPCIVMGDRFLGPSDIAMWDRLMGKKT